MDDHPTNSSRRRFLAAAAAIPTGALAFGATFPSRAQADDSQTDYLTKDGFDRLDLAFNDGNGYRDETNDKDSSGLGGKLAWGEAYILQGYALMYETYRDTHYLDKMVSHIDHVLANRDSERGVTDHTGASQPAWRTDNPYTVGYGTLLGGDSTPVFEVRSALAYGDSCQITVSEGSVDGTFDLDIYNAQYDRHTIHQSLSSDSQSPDYAVTRVTTGFAKESPARVLMTLRDLREADGDQIDLAPGTYPLQSPAYIFEVHTGQIVLPLVLFAKFVQADPELQANATYRDRARVYLEAAEQAVAVHDREWRQNDLGEGYYITLPDAPVWHAGMDNPLNHFLSLGRAVLQLALVTDKQIYADRAAAMALTLQNSLTEADGAFVWPYWWTKGDAYAGWNIDNPRSQYRPWYPPNRVPEDSSHGQIEVNFAVETYRALSTLRRSRRPSFTGVQMERFAATFVQNVATTNAGRSTVYRFIDGTGATDLEAYERQSAAWADLAPWDAQILTHLRDMFSTREFAMQPSTLYCVARLNHAAHGQRQR